MNSSTSALAVADQTLHEHPEQAAGPVVAVKDWGFNAQLSSGRVLALLCTFIERLCAVVLALDVMVVFVSVILRYFVHHPVDWAEEVARGLMVMLVFLGGATVLARKQHVHVDFFRALLPAGWQQAAHQIGGWLVAGTAAGLAYSSWLLLEDSVNVATPMGLPQWLNVLPVFVGAVLMTVVGIANAVNGATRMTWLTLIGCLVFGGGIYGWNSWTEAYALQPWSLLLGGFICGLLVGVPIAFVLALCALLYFIGDPTLPMVIYSQQVMAGMDHFVLLAIPFFVLAGLVMEVNGMSSRLIELLVRVFGRVRGSMNLIAILATAFFSGVSGSKLADIAAVGGIVVPAVRRTRQDPAETAAVLAASGVMAETIPPCINMIIMGFVANISIGGLFLAGIVPAVVLAMGLATLAVIFGRKVDPDVAFPKTHAVVAPAGRGAGGIDHGGNDRQGRDVWRGDFHGGFGVRGGLCIADWRYHLPRAYPQRHRQAFCAFGLDGGGDSVHHCRRIQCGVYPDDPADSVDHFRLHAGAGA